MSANGGAVPEITVTAQTVRELDSVCISDIDSNAIDVQKSYENGIYKLTAKANVKIQAETAWKSLIYERIRNKSGISTDFNNAIKI